MQRRSTHGVFGGVAAVALLACQTALLPGCACHDRDRCEGICEDKGARAECTEEHAGCEECEGLKGRSAETDEPAARHEHADMYAGTGRGDHEDDDGDEAKEDDGHATTRNRAGDATAYWKSDSPDDPARTDRRVTVYSEPRRVEVRRWESDDDARPDDPAPPDRSDRVTAYKARRPAESDDARPDDPAPRPKVYPRAAPPVPPTAWRRTAPLAGAAPDQPDGRLTERVDRLEERLTQLEHTVQRLINAVRERSDRQ